MDKYMPLTESISDQLDLLDLAGEGELVRGLRRYFFNGEEPSFNDRLLQMVYIGCKRKLDENRKHAEEISAIRSEAGKRGGAPVGNQNASKQAKGCFSLIETSNEDRDVYADGYENKDSYPDAYADQTDNQSTSSLSAPPLERGAEGRQNKTSQADVVAYFIQNGSSEIEALAFIGYYARLGWKYKRTGNPIKSWKQAASSWIRKGRDGTASTPEVINGTPTSNNQDQAEEARQKMLAQRKRTTK